VYKFGQGGCFLGHIGAKNRKLGTRRPEGEITGMQLHSLGNWLVGGFATVMGLLGLFISSRAQDTFIYSIGIVVAVGCSLFVLNMVKQAFDEAEKGPDN